MDISEHKKTWQIFMTLTKFVTIAIILTLAVMGYILI